MKASASFEPCCSTSAPSSASAGACPRVRAAWQLQRSSSSSRGVPATPGSGAPRCMATCRRPQYHGSRRRPCTAAAGDDEPQPSASPDQSGEGQPSIHSLNPRMVAAMALSPIAALSLPLVQSEAWQESAREFAEQLRYRVRTTIDSDAFGAWMRGADTGMTFMDWTYRLTGVDLTYVWDPELWVKFKTAVLHDQPQVFWNELMDRVEYKGLIPQAGIVGDMRISYAKFLHLLESNRVKRVVVYGDMKTAIVEVPHPWYASILGAPDTYTWFEDNAGRPLNLLVPNPAAPNDPLQWYCPEMPEWNMEKYRFYVDLPGDFWDQGIMLRYLRSREVSVVWDDASKQYVLPYDAYNKVFQVRTELQVLDPSESWDFLAWLTDANRVEFYEKAAAFCVFGRACTMLLTWLTASPAWKMWDKRKKKKKTKEQTMWDKLTASTAREFMTKDAKTGKMRDTGVRFKDIAGLDHIVVEMKEIVKMLLGDPLYKKVGAKVPRGIIFQGPPGTGKTYMARAIAGEAGVAFFSAVGSEFVEMFAGVAAARVNNLFMTARKRAPAIIFIDEMDAIGRARSTLGADPGSMERESALLAMLVQMDGIHGKLEQVLTIGATNLAQDLDHALLRPGRFEVVYEIPSPGPVARLEILRYHSRNKPLENDAILAGVAQVTQGWSAASLANLMNEAAILTVRRNTGKITLPMMLELVEGINWGTAAGRIPPSEAKNRLALVTAAKAVAFALTPGMEKIKFATMWSQRRGLGPYVEFVRSEESLDPTVHPEMMEVMNWKTNFKTNAARVGGEKLGEFAHIAALLLPLYCPRAAEAAFFGPDGVSLVTASALADCFQIGYHCVRNSMLHPRFRSLPPLHTFMTMGEDMHGRNQVDPLSMGLHEELGYHKLTLTLLRASWRRAQRLIAERRSAIVRIAEAMLAATDERVPGEEIVRIIESTPLDDASGLPAIESDFLPLLKEVLGGKVPGVMMAGAEAAEREEREAAQRRQQQQQEQAQAERAEAKEAEAGAVVAQAAATSGEVSFQPRLPGRPGSVSFARPARSAPSAAAPAAPLATTAASFQPLLLGRPGVASFARTAPPPAAASPGAPPTPPSPPAGTATTAAGATTPEEPALQLDDATLSAVSRAIMGRLDVVDLVGRTTALDAAARVADALRDPATVARLTAVRRYVERDDAAFPPAPLESEVSGPLDGQVGGSLEYWKRRHFSTISWSAVEMLYSERQMELFRDDMDVPRFEDTSQGKKKAREEAQKKEDAATPEQST